MVPSILSRLDNGVLQWQLLKAVYYHLQYFRKIETERFVNSSRLSVSAITTEIQQIYELYFCMVMSLTYCCTN
ncbi:unnamed protein product [Schistosoma spindalis]|nr:unnamed protein product [Schistosoma spindale]